MVEQGIDAKQAAVGMAENRLPVGIDAETAADVRAQGAGEKRMELFRPAEAGVAAIAGVAVINLTDRKSVV